mgnify:FL=1
MYDLLDALIVENITHAKEATLYHVDAGRAREEAEAFARETGRYRFRVIDGRLQSLRKRGVIAYAKGYWRLVTPT